MSENNILHANNWSDMFKDIINNYSQSQSDYYKNNSENEDIREMARLDSKRFGSVSEEILRNLFDLGPRTSTQNDGTKNGIPLEIKAARRWAGRNDCKWQHIEPEHDYHCLLLALLDFDGWKVWIINKSVLFGVCRDNNLIEKQGLQGWWCKKSKIMPYLTEIHNTNDLVDFLNTI
jgi:hypothetical protein